MDSSVIKEVKTQEWLSEGFELYKENFGLLVLSGLVVTLLSAVTIGLLAGPMLAGLALITLRLYDNDMTSPSVGDVFKGFNFFLNTLLFCIVWGVAILVIVLILNVIPLIGQLLSFAFTWAAQAILMFSLFLIVDRGMGFWEASMASINMVKTNFWPFLIFGVITSVIGSVGGMLCGIGMIFTLPLQVCMLTVAYRASFRGEFL